MVATGRKTMDPRILYLTTHNPCGETYGAQLRALHIGRALTHLASVTLVLAREGEITSGEIEAARAEFDDVRILHLSGAPSDFLQRVRRHLSLGIGNSFPQTCSWEEKRNFSEWASEQDLIWAHGLRIPSALRLDGKIRTFIDIDDIPSQLLRSQAVNQILRIKRVKLRIKAREWRYREARLLNAFAGLGVCSEADRIYLGAHPSIHVIPNGFQAPEGIPRRYPASSVRIGFIGTFNYSPNVDGMAWFIRQVWPRIKSQHPSARLRLVGQATDTGKAGRGVDVDGLGYIEDPTSEIASWSIMVVPIFVGGGTRVKISEAFSRKCPVVSTSPGAYGYDVSDGNELLIADKAAAFADACLRLIHRPLEAAQMAERAWGRFLKEWTWDAANPKVWAAVEDCLRRPLFDEFHVRFEHRSDLKKARARRDVEARLFERAQTGF